MMTFLKNLKVEMAHVVWPNRKQTIWFTVVVIVVALFTAYYLGLFDFIFVKLLSGALS